MFRKILVPLDGSNLAESVVPEVLRLMKVSDAKLVLVRALPDFGIPRLDVQEVMAGQQKEAEEYLAEVHAQLESLGVRAERIVRRGDPADVILTVAETEKADLIAMSTHGRSGVQKWFFGSVAEKVRAHAPVPLLLIRAEETDAPDWAAVRDGRWAKILVPLDGSPLAEEALPYARMLAEAFEGEVVLLRAYQIPPVYGVDAASMIGELADDAGRYLAGVEEDLPGKTRSILEEGIPADRILAVADDEKPDLVVMTTHGRTGLSQFVLGSVADRVVRGLWGPVLLVRSKAPAEAE